MGAEKRQTLEAILEKASMDAKYWDEAIYAFASYFGAKGALFIPIESKYRGAWLTFTRELSHVISAYLEEGWYLNDFREKFAPIGRRQGYATDYDITTKEEMEVIPYYKDFLHKHGLGICIGLSAPTPNGDWYMTAHFSKDKPPISENEIVDVLEIRELFNDAVQTSIKTSQEKLQSYLSLLGESNNDILLLDLDGMIIQHIQGAGLLSNSQNESYADLAGLDFYGFLKPEHIEACTKVLQTAPHDNYVTSWKQTIDEVDCEISIRQLPISLRHFYSAAKAIVYISKNHHAPSDMDQILIRDFVLTSAEAQTALFLSKGHSVQEIAEVLGNTEGTVRQKIKAIMSKTSTNSQVQLVVLILNHLK